jgi:hypothetical protein
MVRTARAGARAPAIVIVIVAVTLAVTGCAVNKVAAENCVPRMRIAPATIHPGDSITVESADSCNVKVPSKGWVVVAGHVGAGKTLVQVNRSDEFTGSFRVELTLPSDFPVGEAYAGVDNWDYSTCADTGSCAGPMASFTVEP